MNDNLPLESVLFDLDNTLIDRDAGYVRYCRSVYRQTPGINQACSEQRAVDLLVGFDGNGLRPWEDIFADVIAEWPKSFASVDEAMALRLTLYPQSMALDDKTTKLLADLRARGTKIGIVSNGSSETQHAKIASTGLNRMVDAVVVSGDFDFRKPDPQIFEHALSEIGGRADSTIFVGDNPDADILGAAALGLRTAWVHRGRDWPHADRDPDHIIGHVSDIWGLLVP